MSFDLAHSLQKNTKIGNIVLHGRTEIRVLIYPGNIDELILPW